MERSVEHRLASGFVFFITARGKRSYWLYDGFLELISRQVSPVERKHSESESVSAQSVHYESRTYTCRTCYYIELDTGEDRTLYIAHTKYTERKREREKERHRGVSYIRPLSLLLHAKDIMHITNRVLTKRTRALCSFYFFLRQSLTVDSIDGHGLRRHWTKRMRR